jgi:hypothetical protein
MKKTHAPGPWYVANSNAGTHVSAADSAIVCLLRNCDKERMANNAKLIAAAPELLSALIGLMYMDGGEPAFINARIAIGKAT